MGEPARLKDPSTAHFYHEFSRALIIADDVFWDSLFLSQLCLFSSLISLPFFTGVFQCPSLWYMSSPYIVISCFIFPFFFNSYIFPVQIRNNLKLIGPFGELHLQTVLFPRSTYGMLEKSRLPIEIMALSKLRKQWSNGGNCRICH